MTSAPDLEAVRDAYRKTHLVVRTDGEWVAYRHGRRGRWDQWRAIQMMGGLGSERVAVVPTVHALADQPHPATVGAPDFVPTEWGVA